MSEVFSDTKPEIICGVLMVVFSSLTVIERRLKIGIIWFWILGMSVSGYFLWVGSDLVAFLQFILSTLGAIGLYYHSLALGEYVPFEMDRRSRTDSPESAKPVVRSIMSRILPALLPGFLGVVVAFCVRQALVLLRDSGLVASASFRSHHPGAALGGILQSSYLISFEVLGLIFLACFVGAGAMSRSKFGEKL